MADPDEVLAFWLDETGPEGWYNGGEALDGEITRRFRDTWQRSRDGALSLWLTYPSGSLAYIILTDQFPRNMFRGSGEAFATDRAGLAAAKMAVSKGWDMRIDEPARQFFYVPLMHSEAQSDQDRCVRLILSRLPETGADNLRHARAHREVIRRFGRFPYRNDALGRETTPSEREYLEQGGYASTLKAMTEAA